MSDAGAAKLFSHLGIDAATIEAGDDAARRIWLTFFESPDLLRKLADLDVAMTHYAVWIPEGDYGHQYLDDELEI